MTAAKQRKARLPRLAAGIPLCLLLVAAPLLAAEPELQVIGFSDKLLLTVNGRPVPLDAGSLGFSIPPGSRAEIQSGEATLLVEGSLLKAAAGSAFSYLSSGGQAQVLVHKGAVEITAGGRAPVSIPAGRFAALNGPEAGKLVGPPAAEPERKPGPAEPKPFDPLTALGDTFQTLAQLQKPELRFTIELHPYYRIRQSYDTNMYLVPPDGADGSRVGGGVLSSMITQNSLGSLFKMPLTKRHTLGGSYDVTALNYSKQPRANNSLAQTIELRDDYQGQNVTAQAYERYVNTEDPAFSELVARERRFQNSVGASLRHQLSRRLVYTLDGQHSIHKYLNPGVGRLLNRYDLEFGGDFGLLVAPKTRVYAAYHREISHYSAGRNNNSKSHRLGLGVEGRFTQRLTGVVESSFYSRRHDLAGQGGGRTATDMNLKLRLDYKLTRHDDFRFNASRTLSATTFGTNQLYTATSGGATYLHRFRLFSVGMNGSIEFDTYPEASGAGGRTASRRDDIYSGGVNLEYPVRKWLATSLSYQRRQRFSTFSGQFNYKTDISAAELRITF